MSPHEAVISRCRQQSYFPFTYHVRREESCWCSKWLAIPVGWGQQCALPTQLINWVQMMKSTSGVCSISEGRPWFWRKGIFRARGNSLLHPTTIYVGIYLELKPHSHLLSSASVVVQIIPSSREIWFRLLQHSSCIGHYWSFYAVSI